MIPLSQYLAEDAGEGFTPLMALATRKAQVANTTKVRPLKILPKGSQPAPPAAPAAAAAPAPRLVTEPRVPQRELDAERAGRAADRRAHEAAIAEATLAARLDGIEIGRVAAEERMETEFAERLEAIRGDLAGEHAAAVIETRDRWTSEQADRLADLLILQVAILEETVKLNLGNVLRPLALDVRGRQTVDEMVGALRTIVLDGSAYRIAASGPSDLLSALEVKLGDEARLVAFTPDEEKTDIRIDADATVIESRLSSWRSALDEALS